MLPMYPPSKEDLFRASPQTLLQITGWDSDTVHVLLFKKMHKNYDMLPKVRVSMYICASQAAAGSIAFCLHCQCVHCMGFC